MKVFKFGGTSMGSAATFQQVAQIVLNEKDAICVVLSAMGGVTNLLLKAGSLAAQKDKNYLKIYQEIHQKHIETAKILFPLKDRSSALSEITVMLNAVEELLQGIFSLADLSPKTLAKLSSSGELISSYIFQQYLLLAFNEKATLLPSKDLIKVEGTYNSATVLKNTTENNLKAVINNKGLYIIPGFICSNENEEICTLGRGGSDYTSALVAAAVNAEKLLIWTDVSGLYTSNPKMVKEAFPVPIISYQEAMELSHFGAKVIYAPTIQPVLEKEIPIYIKNTFSIEDKGTFISTKNDSSKIIAGISHVENMSLLTLEGASMVGIPGFSMRLFKALAVQKINVIFITQASSEHSICIGISSEDIHEAKRIVNEEFAYEISLKRINPVLIENDLSIIALVGDNMKNHQGISGKMFNVLGRNNINIRAIAQGASERNISTVVHKKHVSKALNVLHEAFFESHKLGLNIFVLGVGNVGQKLLEQLHQQKTFLKQELNMVLNVIAIANSKQLLINENGVDLAHWKTDLTNATTYQLFDFIEKIKELNLPNSIVVDNTASEKISEVYASFLKESIPVVTCNKIACSSNFESYKNLKNLAKKYNAPFLFETNVGAGLPVINTLQNLMVSGDQVIEIQAVLSGSLNFIFNTYNTEITFADVIKEAGIQGFTEPDTRIDLSGVDVMRKILILARESGAKLEMEDIKNISFLPENALKTSSVDEFLKLIKKEEEHFKNMYLKAQKNKSQLKFVAKYNAGGASVGLEEIPSNHPFYNLEGKDNIILFYTQRYKEQPLIIKGAGAGAEVTASGIFADIIKLANL